MLFIGYTWYRWVRDADADPEWLVHLAMTKAIVRAMDTVQAFMKSPFSPPEIQALEANPQQFLVAGASKRGWITWMISAVDPRVIAIVPVVFDLLNMRKSLKHHYMAYGGWSFAFEVRFTGCHSIGLV